MSPRSPCTFFTPYRKSDPGLALMSKAMPTIWDITPHTQAKHLILKEYIRAWLSIVGQKFQRVLFVDGFCGPGVYSGGEPGSPIIVIDEAASVLQGANIKPDLSFEVHCIDHDLPRIKNLEEILKGKTITDDRLRVMLPKHGEFEDEVVAVLERREKAYAQRRIVIPAFFFADPFGVKGVPMELVSRIFKVPGSELLLLFDGDGFDRVLMAWDQVSKDLLVSIFQVELNELEQIKALPTQVGRIQALRKMYVASLKEKSRANLFLSFTMYDKSDRPVYDLIFLTDNELGFEKMKEAMWKADASGEFRFSDADETQARFAFGNHVDRLWDDLTQRFGGQEVAGAVVTKFVLHETLFLSKHKTATLTKYEREDTPEHQRILVMGRKRNRKGSFPADVRIRFPKVNHER